jgi:hypothetical protein
MVSDIDPFSDDFFAGPYAFHEQVRDAGPVVWLERYGIRGMTRYSELMRRSITGRHPFPGPAWVITTCASKRLGVHPAWFSRLAAS